VAPTAGLAKLQLGQLFCCFASRFAGLQPGMSCHWINAATLERGEPTVVAGGRRERAGLEPGEPSG